MENRDFVIFTQKGEYRKPLIEYHFTVDAGKHIAMMSGTDKGFQVRDYFIECERRYKAMPRSPQEIMAEGYKIAVQSILDRDAKIECQLLKN